jgi:hypothetical protein
MKNPTIVKLKLLSKSTNFNLRALLALMENLAAQRSNCQVDNELAQIVAARGLVLALILPMAI